MAIELDLSSAQAQPVPGTVGEVTRLAYPVVLQTLSDTAMQVVDAAIVGHLGATELGACGFGGIWLWTLLVGFVGAATGVQTFVSQEFGAGKQAQTGRWIWIAVVALLPVACVWFALVALGFGPLLRLLGPSAELRSLATAYAHMRLLGAPAVVIGVVYTSFFRGLGDTRTPLLATVIANLINAAAAYALVFGRFGLPAWGVAGAGMGTAIANWTYTLILLGLVLRRSQRRRYGTAAMRVRWDAVRRFARTGAPIGGQFILDMASFALFSTIIARMGDAQIAASQAMIQMLALSFMQAFGISIASGALVGRYIGAGDYAAARRSHSSALTLGVGLAAVVAALFLTLPDALLHLFLNDPTVIALGRPLLRLGALFQLIDAVGIITGGSLRGAGDTRWPFLVQATLAWGVRLPFVGVAALLLHGGVLAAWTAELGYITVLCVAFVRRFDSGAWERLRI